MSEKSKISFIVLMPGLLLYSMRAMIKQIPFFLHYIHTSIQVSHWTESQGNI